MASKAGLGFRIQCKPGLTIAFTSRSAAHDLLWRLSLEALRSNLNDPRPDSQLVLTLTADDSIALVQIVDFGSTPCLYLNTLWGADPALRGCLGELRFAERKKRCLAQLRLPAQLC